jgi:D-alanyl-D-alanine carboxypeptidase
MHPQTKCKRNETAALSSRAIKCLPFIALFLGLCTTGFGGGAELPESIRKIMEKPQYAEATWALRVVDLQSGEVIYDLNSAEKLLTGSVRKLYSVGTALNKLGADDRFKTPVFRNGEVDAAGNLKGDLILVAKGDLTMGGRDNGNDTVAVTNWDHNDADNLGSAILTKPDPLAGLDKLASQVVASGITRVSGDVIIDDRLFPQFRVPNQELLITPIIINDNRIDVTILPTEPGKPAQVIWRPHTAAFQVTGVTLDPTSPHAGTVRGQIAVGFVPPLPGVQTLVRTFRVDNPNAPDDTTVSFARTTFIEALERAGVTVAAPLVAPNPSDKLPSTDVYCAANQVAELVSAPYAQYSKLTPKI